jgi:signal transduction histidine kinase
VPWLFYLRLIGYTAGTLTYLFLIVLILGHRRPRLFERLLFFLVLSLFAIYAGELLQINAEIEYGSPPAVTRLFYQSLVAFGILLVLPLVVQTHVEYLRQARGKLLPRWVGVLSYSLFLLPAAMLVYVAITARTHATWGLDGSLAALVRQFWLVFVSAIIAAIFELRIALTARGKSDRSLFWCLFASCLVFVVSWIVGPSVAGIEIAGALPGALLIYFALRHKFLGFGAQRNLVYALSASTLALLYLALVRRVSGWMEPVLPPEATASILLFVLIFLFEPLERAIGPLLHRRMSERMGHVQRLTVDLQQEARQGNVERLIRFAERRVSDEFGLAAVRISVPCDAAVLPLESPGGLGHAVQVPLKKDGDVVGMLEAASTGAYLTGETSAGLEFIGEQLPAMIDLCRLIEEKVRLERELAERERLALLGQMAASVSHNLRNPLSSMKTILQVQLEHPNLPLDVRHDCALVVAEIDRMGEKLKQLLNFAKPSVNGQSVAAVALARQTASLFARDAERRNLRLEFDGPTEEIFVLASEDALGEVLSNLVVNAIEAQPNGGRVRVGLALIRRVPDEYSQKENNSTSGAEALNINLQLPPRLKPRPTKIAGLSASSEDDSLEIRVEDHGPGISQELRAKMFQPYFTTKATGTGLGLSIVARRVDEMGGTISCESPLREGKGTRFRVTLPVATTA